MAENGPASPTKQAQAAALLAAADQILTGLENLTSGNGPTPHFSLRQASFLTRLAATLLIEPDFPDLPAGWERFLDRGRVRHAARQLTKSPGREYRAFAKQKAEPAPRNRNPGVPLTETDRRLGMETMATLRQRETLRRELLNEYLRWKSDSPASRNPEVQTASLALLDRYSRSRQRLLEITEKRTAKSAPRRIKAAYLHPPAWKHDVTWELWQSLDQRCLFWSDLLPFPNQAPLSQEP